MTIKKWWISNGIWFLILAILSWVIDSRKYDGSGEYQTTQLKLISLAVFVLFAILVIIFQYFLYKFIKKRENRHYSH